MSSIDQSAIVLPEQKSLLRRIWSYPAMEHYYRLVIVVLTANLMTLAYGVVAGGWFQSDARHLSDYVLSEKLKPKQAFCHSNHASYRTFDREYLFSYPSNCRLC
jgi:hypothetical protein